jgi:hypothetical protein
VTLLFSTYKPQKEKKVDKTTRTVEPEKTVPPATEAATFAASWDVFYQDAQGLECHLQIRGTSIDDLLGLATGTSMAITEGGAKPSRRMAGNSHGATHNGDKPKENGNGNGNGSANGNGNAANNSFREPSYVDERGTRRCNRKLTDGAICGRPVTEKEGRYGNFWSCPNYKSHAPAPAH